MAPIDNNPLSSLTSSQVDSKAAADKKNEALGQGDFLQLLLTQLKNQDPTSPMEQTEFLTQMAQFSTVDGVQGLQTSMQSLVNTMNSTQALQASSLVGKSVLVSAQSTQFDGSKLINGQVDVPIGASDMKIEISNAAGQVVRTVNVPQLESGPFKFAWDGSNETGDLQPSGQYQFKVTALVGSAREQLATSLSANVDSVTLGKGGQGMTLNLAGVGARSLAEIQEIGQ